LIHGLRRIKAGFLVSPLVFDLRELSLRLPELARAVCRENISPDLFIIDGRLNILPPKSGEILLQIIMRHENRSTPITSNHRGMGKAP
jgi:hypothetical protein